ncbi:MAG: 30S ribosomal protein S2 [Candidatus Omnitrophica bacterium]|nr:30S ribosomal protein S2 [Candidatus Omnitrophota bacterium]
MVDELIKQLLEAGVHFGHQTRRWNPKMKKFIFGQRNGIHIIDLEKTVEQLNKARDFVRASAVKGGKFLFISTKKQAKMILEEEAKKIAMFYVTNRWPGGLLTNFQTVRKSIGRMKEIERMEQDGTWSNLKKKETSRLAKEKEKIEKDLGGIREMPSAPDVVFIVDTKKEAIAVKEARKLNIPIVALVDTNSDPDPIDYPIPGNDDALKSIRIIASLIAESIMEGRKEFFTAEAAAKKADGEAAGVGQKA